MNKYFKSIIVGFLMSVILIAIGIGLGHLIMLSATLDIKYSLTILLGIATVFFSYLYFKKNY